MISSGTRSSVRGLSDISNLPPLLLEMCGIDRDSSAEIDEGRRDRVKIGTVVGVKMQSAAPVVTKNHYPIQA